MQINRDRYLNQLIQRMHNGLIKVVTGVKGCGRSYLVFTLFQNYLRSVGRLMTISFLWHWMPLRTGHTGIRMYCLHI